MYKSLNMTGWIFIVWTALYPFLRGVCDVYMCQCLESAIELFEEFRIQWSSARDELRKCEMVQAAKKLDDILFSLNSALGPGMVAEFALTLWMLTFSLFFGVMTFTGFSGGFKHLVVFYGSGMLFWSVVIIYKAAKIVGKSQRLTGSMKCVKHLMQELNVACPDKANSINQVIEKFGSRSAALRPFDAFDVSYSNALSLSGWLITNIIILLQFRVAEVAA